MPDDGRESSVEINILGSVEGSKDGCPVHLEGPQQRCILAVLALEVGRVVPLEQLIEAVWGEHPPRTARNSLQGHISRLRRKIGEQAVSTHNAGYRLRVDSRQIDVHRFRELVLQARNCDEPESAARLLREALRLWRGSALSGFDSEWARKKASSLGEERLGALEERIDADLRLGRHAELVTELPALISDHPLRERLVGQLMLALYRANRPAEALVTYQRTREVLNEELGADPGPALQALHERMLRNNPDLVPPARKPGRRNDLPGDVADFTGRKDELNRLRSGLSEVDGMAVVVFAIDGMAGIGKTAFAVHVAHHLSGRYPDAQVFIDLHAHSVSHQPTDPATALDALLRALGVPGDRIPHELDERAALWRAELADRKALVVLDNAATAAQVRPLLPGIAGCLTLVTSRRRLADLEAAHTISLDVLPPVDARALFERVLGDGRAAAEHNAVQDVLKLCGHLPLAIRIAAARLRSRPTWTIAHFQTRLRERRQRLSELTLGDQSMAAAFTLSYNNLTPPQRRMFRLLGLHPGHDFDAHAAASLAHLELDTAERLLEELLDVHLLQQSAPGRYYFHDLLRHHAGHTVHQIDPETERREALARLTDHLLRTAHTADRLLAPHRDAITLGRLTPGSHPHRLADETAALTWFTAEHPNLLASQQLCLDRGWYHAVYQLAWTLTTFHWRRGHLHEELAVWRAALTAADQLGEPATHILVHRLLGRAHAQLSQHTEAIKHLQQALSLANQVGDTRGQAHIHRSIALTWVVQGEEQRALEHSAQALRLYQALDLPAWTGWALGAMGWSEARLGRYEHARTHCEAALTLGRRHHHRDVEAAALDSLGYIAHHTEHLTQALDYYRHALSLRRDLGHAAGEADTLDRIGHTLHALGQHAQARASWQHALTLYQAQHRTADADRIQRQLDDHPMPSTTATRSAAARPSH